VAAKQTPVRSIRVPSIGVRAWPIWKLRAWPIWKLRDWPIWTLRDWLLAFVVVVVLADAVVFGLAVSSVTVHARDLLLFTGLLASSAATVELTRQAGENNGMSKDVYAGGCSARPPSA